jgi:hypothetical protein
MSRKLFAAGCWVLVALGFVHLLGHASLMSAQGDSEAERQMLAMMRTNPQDMGLGFVRTMFDIVAGFSLTFSLLPAGMGLVGLLVVRREGSAPGLLREIAIAYAGIYGIMTAVALRYWFPAPLFFLAAAFLCFAAAVASARRP